MTYGADFGRDGMTGDREYRSTEPYWNGGMNTRKYGHKYSLNRKEGKSKGEATHRGVLSLHLRLKERTLQRAQLRDKTKILQRQNCGHAESQSPEDNIRSTEPETDAE